MNWFLKLFNSKPKVIVICGPTATGKTALSVALAKCYDGEIISADSRQVYRGLDIGSAKVTTEEMEGIPHYMIDVAEASNIFTVQEYVQQARIYISDIIQRKKTPIICGGTGMYVDALVHNQSFPSVPPNILLRKKLEKLSTEELFNQLQEKDSIRANAIDKHNKVRLVRALEIIDAIGVVPKQKTSLPYKTLFIGLDSQKVELYERIHMRIIERLEKQNMLQEAIDLHIHGLSFERMESLGLEYRYMARHLKGEIDYDEMILELTTKTIQFAKRQRTWFKRNKNIHWFNPIKDQIKIKKYVSDFLRK